MPGVGGTEPPANDRSSFLPDDTPHGKATSAMRQTFAGNSGLSDAVVVFERTGGKLTPDDMAAIERIVDRIGRSDSIEQVERKLRPEHRRQLKDFSVERLEAADAFMNHRFDGIGNNESSGVLALGN